MKKFTKYILFISLGLLCSCSDYLDIVPDNVTTLDIVFNNKNTAQRYLANAIISSPIMVPVKLHTR